MRATLTAAALLTLLGAAVAAAQGDSRPRASNQDQIERLSAAQAQQAVAAGTALLVDTRDPSAFDQEHAKGAVSFYRVETGSAGPELPREKLIITYCT